MEIFERFGYMRSIFKCELSCGLELKGDYSLLLITKLASCFFQLACLSTVVVVYHHTMVVVVVVVNPDPFTEHGFHTFHFSCGSQHMDVPRTSSRIKIISQRSTCKFSTKNTAMALSLIFLRRLCLGSGATL